MGFMASKETRVLDERESLVEYISKVQSQPLDFDLVLGSIQSATSSNELNSNLVSIFDLEDPNFSEQFTIVSYLGAAMGARSGNPKRLKEDEVETFAVSKKEVSFEYALDLLENRVAVQKYYYDELPKDLKKLSFYVSGLEKLREIELIKSSLSNAVANGYSFAEWKDSVDEEAFKNLSEARLQTVYRNNVNNVYNQSLRYNAGTSDVTPYLQYTAIGDSDTRPSHLKLDGTIKRADSEFWDRYTPPIGHNCTSFNQKISGNFKKAFRVFYKSDMVRIYLKSGKIISGVTLNHPMMTNFGFVHAKDLQVGDDLIVNNTEVKKFNTSWNINYNNVTSTASNLFKAMFLQALSIEKSASFNFHDDIKFMNKEVDVVSCDRFLSSNSEVAFKGFEKFIFKFSNYIGWAFPFSCVRSFIDGIALNIIFMKNFSNVARRNRKLTSNGPGGLSVFGIQIKNSFFNLFNIFSEKFLLRHSSRFVSKHFKSSIDRVSTDSELQTKFVNADSFIEGVDQVVDIKFYPYVGFVYDFESSHGLIITDEIVTSNCRCGVISLSTEDAKDLGISNRNNDSFPKPDEDFGDKNNKTYGNVLGATTSATKKALKKLPTSSPFRSRFQKSLDSVDQKVDIWWETNKNKFKR